MPVVIPALLLGALATAIIYALSGGKDSPYNKAKGAYDTYKKVEGVKDAILPKGLPSLSTTKAVSVGGDLVTVAAPPLPPHAQRLLAYLVLFARDKVNPAGQKKFLTYEGAKDAVNIAQRLGLHKTARAIKLDDPVPDDEYLPGRTVSIRKSVVLYGTTGKA